MNSIALSSYGPGIIMDPLKKEKKKKTSFDADADVEDFLKRVKVAGVNLGAFLNRIVRSYGHDALGALSDELQKARRPEEPALDKKSREDKRL